MGDPVEVEEDTGSGGSSTEMAKRLNTNGEETLVKYVVLILLTHPNPGTVALNFGIFPAVVASRAAGNFRMRMDALPIRGLDGI